MTDLPSITGSQLIRALRKVGFAVIRIKGSHHFLQHQDGRCTVVPVHRVESIGRELLSKNYGTAISQKKICKRNCKRTFGCCGLGSLAAEQYGSACFYHRRSA